jgi:hypothetical protein
MGIYFCLLSKLSKQLNLCLNHRFKCQCASCTTSADRARAFHCRTPCNGIIYPNGLGNECDEWHCTSCNIELDDNDIDYLLRLETITQRRLLSLPDTLRAHELSATSIANMDRDAPPNAFRLHRSHWLLPLSIQYRTD